MSDFSHVTPLEAMLLLRKNGTKFNVNMSDYIRNSDIETGVCFAEFFH